ncbi:MAG: thiosulfate oxidation carrier protein SoxY [Acidiferrobacterales bacterium]
MKTPVNVARRRVFLKGAAAGSVAAAIAGSGWLRSPSALAADWPKTAFTAASTTDALTALYGTSDASASEAIRVKAPAQAENGALVPVEVSTTLPNVDSIAITVDRNPRPFVCRMSFSGAEPFIGVRIKMRQTSAVRCVVRSEGKLYVKTQLVKVTVGGYDS